MVCILFVFRSFLIDLVFVTCNKRKRHANAEELFQRHAEKDNEADGFLSDCREGHVGRQPRRFRVVNALVLNISTMP